MMIQSYPHSETYIVLPVFNEDKVIRGVISAIINEGFTNIIAVDDASSDNTYNELNKTQAISLKHRVNRGKGAATKTGIAAARMLSAKYIVTMDSDGQHDPSDIKPLLSPIIAGLADISLGTRLKNPQNMPRHKLIMNRAGNFITYLFSGQSVSDSQCGFRAFSNSAIEHLNTKADRYDYETEMIREINKFKIPFTEVPVKTVYSTYSMSKNQKQNIANGIKTIYSLIWKKISL